MFRFIACAVFFVATYSLDAMAAVGKVSSPQVEKGVMEAEYSGVRFSDDSKAQNNQQIHQFEMEYGFTNRFMAGLEGRIERATGESSELKEWGIEAQYALTTQENYWLDSAVKLEYAHAVHQQDADATELNILASHSFKNTRLLVNIGLERELGSNRDAGAELESRFQIRQTINEKLGAGLEWHSSWGRINKLGDSDNQEHYIGPMITGDLFKLAGGDIGYTAGYYCGVTDDSADNAARLQLGYEIKF